MVPRIFAGATVSASPANTSPDGRAPAGVKVERCPYWDDYRGTAEDLIAAGIIRADQLPGSPGLPAGCVTFRNGQRIAKGDSRRARDEGYLQIRRAGKAFYVKAGISADEKARRVAQAEADRARGRQAEREQADIAFRSNPQELRWQAQAMVMMLRKIIANHTPGDHNKGEAHMLARFAPAGLEEVLEALGEVSDWVDSARITVPAPYAPKVGAARADAPFQAFLQSQCLKA